MILACLGVPTCFIGSALSRKLKPQLRPTEGVALTLLSLASSAVCAGPLALLFGIFTLEGGFLLVTEFLGTALGALAWAVFGTIVVCCLPLFMHYVVARKFGLPAGAALVWTLLMAVAYALLGSFAFRLAMLTVALF